MENEKTGYMETYLLFLICRALQKEANSEKRSLTREDFSALLNMAKRHEIQPLAVYGLLLTGGLTKEQEDHCRKLLYTDLIRQEKMDRELHRTCSLLEEAGIDYMPLKGAVLRKFYPEPWLRTSCDVDILVRDVDRAVKLLVENGYTNKGRGSHDVILTSPLGVTIELHFKLIETDARIDTLLEHVWAYSIPREGTHHYEMQPEMFYFYHIAHMAKHMRFGGCGIRNFADIWLLTDKLQMDEEKKNRLLRSGGLAVFAEQSERLSRVWFEGQRSDTVLQELEQFVLNGGVFGSKSNAVKLHRTQANTSVKFYLLRLFMPYSRMVLKYPILKKQPFLLPLFWLRRWIELLLKGRKINNAFRELELSRKMDDQSIAVTKWLFQELELL